MFDYSYYSLKLMKDEGLFLNGLPPTLTKWNLRTNS